jgi:hypothetical protein
LRVATKTLRIDGTDRDHFFLALDAGTLRVGDHPDHPDGTLRGLRVVRIRCEVEVEDGPDAVRLDVVDAAASPRELGPGAAVEVGHSRLSLLAADSPPAAAPAAGLTRRLLVIDGADHGKVFKLPADGLVTIGKTGKGVDIGLDDIYVARVHCQLTVAGEITVAHIEGRNGTLIDGRKIEKPELLPVGHVLRVGNSHLRLEAGVFPDEPPAGGSRVLRPPVSKPIGPPKSADPASKFEGQLFGHYRVGSVLGRGFVGVAFRASDENTGQPVALKVFSADFPTNSTELGKFSRAIRDAQQVRHPNLVAPLAAGKTGPNCWIAREFVDGESAADAIERIRDGEKPSWVKAARVATHLARVLEALHRHRVVHGNITPRNVLIRSADHATKLADLGQGPALEGSKLHASVLERKLLAEMPYLAPEQAEPGAFVDDLADLYAVGAVAYALATGRPPVVGSSPEAVLDAVRNGRVDKPSSVYRKIPAAFEGVLIKLLAKAQEDRYAGPAALLADLEPLIQGHDGER